MLVVIIIIVVVAVAVLSGVVSYNRLVRLRNRVASAWSQTRSGSPTRCPRITMRSPTLALMMSSSSL
jgi:hypothetical protein